MKKKNVDKVLNKIKADRHDYDQRFITQDEVDERQMTAKQFAESIGFDVIVTNVKKKKFWTPMTVNILIMCVNLLIFGFYTVHLITR